MIAIIGAGGHAKCVYECLKMKDYQVLGFFDDDRSKVDSEIIDGLKVLGAPNQIFNHKNVSGILIAIGDNQERLSKYQLYLNRKYDFPNAVHLKAHISEFANTGKGNFIMGAAMINPGSVIGDYCIINTNATVGHDCLLEDACQISPGVNIAGGCTIKQGSFIGIGAKVAPGVTIGSWTVVGAGSVVLDDLPDYSFSYGVPAQLVKIIK